MVNFSAINIFSRLCWKYELSRQKLMECANFRAEATKFLGTGESLLKISSLAKLSFENRKTN